MNIVSPTLIYLQENGSIPNNSVLPVLVYRHVLDGHVADKHKLFQHCFEENGWKGVWKNGLYDYHHFHSFSHEVLAIASGSVDVELGGPDQKIINLEAGDVIALPAGTGHKNLRASQNLVVIGGYPAGQEDYNICRHKDDCSADVLSDIVGVKLPISDPIYGKNGPLIQQWQR